LLSDFSLSLVTPAADFHSRGVLPYLKCESGTYFATFWLMGLKAHNMTAWAGASLTSEGPGQLVLTILLRKGDTSVNDRHGIEMEFRSFCFALTGLEKFDLMHFPDLPPGLSHCGLSARRRRAATSAPR
jgi:hypothetical protein